MTDFLEKKQDGRVVIKRNRNASRAALTPSAQGTSFQTRSLANAAQLKRGYTFSTGRALSRLAEKAVQSDYEAHRYLMVNLRKPKKEQLMETYAEDLLHAAKKLQSIVSDAEATFDRIEMKGREHDARMTEMQSESKRDREVFENWLRQE